MTARKSERLELVDNYYPDHDALIRRTAEIESYGEGKREYELLCGQDGELLVRNFSVEEAQHHFGREGVRALMQCPSCGSYNLLAAALEKLDDGSFVALPRRE